MKPPKRQKVDQISKEIIKRFYTKMLIAYYNTIETEIQQEFKKLIADNGITKQEILRRCVQILSRR